MKVNEECLEILNLLLKETRKIKIDDNTKDINNDGILQIQRPLSEWAEQIESNGFQSSLLREFFQSNEISELWKGDETLSYIYDQSIAKNLTTGDFLELLYGNDPDFLEALISLVSPLLSKQDDLMQVAGGKLGPKGDAIVLHTAEGTLSVGIIIAIIYRKKITSLAKELYNDVKNYFNDNDTDLKTERVRWQTRVATHIEHEEEQAAINTVNKDGREFIINYNFEPKFKKISRIDKFDMALKVLEPKSMPPVSHQQVQSLHREERVYVDNPVAGVEELSQKLDNKFNINLSGDTAKEYLKACKTVYDDAISYAERKFLDAINTLAVNEVEKQWKGSDKKRINTYSEKEQKEFYEQQIGQMRQGLVKSSKELSKDKYFKAMITHKDIGDKIKQLETIIEKTKKKLDSLEKESIDLEKELYAFEKQKNVKLDELPGQVKKAKQEIEAAQKLYDQSVEINKKYGIDLAEQKKIFSELSQTIKGMDGKFQANQVTVFKIKENIETAKRELKELVRREEKEASEFEKIKKRSDKDIDLRKMGKYVNEMQTAYKANELGGYIEQLTEIEKKYDGSKLNNLRQEHGETAEKIKILEGSMKKSEAELETAVNKLENAKKEYERFESIEKKISVLTKKRKAILDQMESEIKELEKLETYQTSIIKNKQLIDAALNMLGKNTNGTNHRILTLAIETSKECETLQKSIGQAKEHFLNTLKEADSNAVKQFYLENIQQQYGKDVAELFSGKINFKGKLPDTDQIVKDLTADELEALEKGIDPGINKVIENEIDPLVKSLAYNMFTDLMQADQELNSFVDNVVVDIDSIPDKLI